MEAHERIAELVVVFALDILFVKVLRNTVVDIEQSDGIACHAGADVFAQRAVDVNFAGNRNAAAYQTAVYIAGLKAEFLRECRPAFVGKRDIFAGALVLLLPNRGASVQTAPCAAADPGKCFP